MRTGARVADHRTAVHVLGDADRWIGHRAVRRAELIDRDVGQVRPEEVRCIEVEAFVQGTCAFAAGSRRPRRTSEARRRRTGSCGGRSSRTGPPRRSSSPRRRTARCQRRGTPARRGGRCGPDPRRGARRSRPACSAAGRWVRGGELPIGASARTRHRGPRAIPSSWPRRARRRCPAGSTTRPAGRGPGSARRRGLDIPYRKHAHGV